MVDEKVDDKIDEKGITRRDFVICGAVSAGATVCLCGISGCSTFTGVGKTPPIDSEAYTVEEGPEVVVNLDKTPDLSIVGGSVKIIDSRLLDALIIARVGENEYVAASIHCTHRGVELEYHHDKKQFICSSAGSSAFDLKGNRIMGPAEKNLRIYNVRLDGNLLKIDLRG
ncbi:MAG: Rieske 2Fe-2S domain-containing protein [Deltaproteobacteria bacterium]|uniref:Rieske 2Fe-2S domain-containing protein n=1 Tax=Candidatus Zymogenus saltonus TaxID=2844893 RepID=A0A9D8PQB8_9DELT|nr:Rieske 2Fe-2S domain-containing protein [Candidatus Zymogenus saltonus]